MLLEKQGKIIALEVKSGNRHKLPGMEAFEKQFAPHKMLLIGGGGLPCHEFLKINPNELF